MFSAMTEFTEERTYAETRNRPLPTCFEVPYGVRVFSTSSGLSVEAGCGLGAISQMIQELNVNVRYLVIPTTTKTNTKRIIGHLTE
jgi:hypothetical protein